jgi:hypothetical protein
MVGERIARIRYKREKGYLYYVKSDDEGWLCVYRSRIRKLMPVNTETQPETVENNGEQN